MAWHGGLKKRKKTGGKKRAYRSKRLHELGKRPIENFLGEPKRKSREGAASRR